MKKIICTIAAIASMLSAVAQNKSTIPVEAGEKWWGLYTGLGNMMPLSEATRKYSLEKENINNQAVPFMVSSYGRYIWSEDPFDFQYDGTNIMIDSPTEQVTAVKIGKNLREAYVLAYNKHFKGNGQAPPELFFTAPQYNTWIELMYNQNQADVERYADDILANNFPPGVLMIDDNWQRDYGNFEFKADKFPDPKAMMDKLHKQGFKVMLWISPFVSPDSPEFRDLEAKGYLIKEKGSKQAAVIRWWNGVSGCYDLTNPEATKHLTGLLKNMQTEYGIDGFKFDAGDFNFYNAAVQDSYKADAKPADHAMAWQRIGLEFPYNEYRASWKMQAAPLVQRLSDKDYSWGALRALIPDMLNAGLMGYAYTCPDMVGGGQFGSFLDVDQSKMDQTLIVRSAQTHALMPMMQFSVAPWRILDKEHLEYCRQAALLHTKMAPYIKELADEAARTGEPIMRHMEYMFPHKGFSNCNDQFMLGSKYIVAPVTSADGKRTVRIPKGQWIDDKGQKVKGPIVLELQVEPGRLPYYESTKK